MATQTSIEFLFESKDDGGYVDVLGDSALVDGPIVTQNAGSSDFGIYYQVGGGGLNGVFARELGTTRANSVNAKLRSAYDARFGQGRFKADSESPPPQPVLTSFLVPLDPIPGTGGRVTGMLYSVGPKLPRGGLTPSVLPIYAQVYLDAMDAIAASPTGFAGFRITLLSSGIYRNGAPPKPFATAAATAIIGAFRTGIRNAGGRLSGLTILVNADRGGTPPMEVYGFTQAATALGATVTARGFSIPVS